MRINKAPQERGKTPTIRIADDVYAQLWDLHVKSREPVNHIASEALRFALAHTKLVPTECYEVAFVERTDEE